MKKYNVQNYVRYKNDLQQALDRGLPIMFPLSGIAGVFGMARPAGLTV